MDRVINYDSESIGESIGEYREYAESIGDRHSNFEIPNNFESQLYQCFS